jgi:hypothetical protein
VQPWDAGGKRVARTGTRLLRGTVVALAFVALAATIHAPVMRGDHTFMWSGDNPIQSYAWMHKLVAAWRAGEVPLWDFSINSGTSFIGELQTGALYPPNVLLSLLHGRADVRTLDRYLVLHFAVTAALMWWLLRLVGCGAAAALAGAIVWAFIGTVAQKAQAQMNIFMAMVWLPGAAAAFLASIDDRARQARSRGLQVAAVLTDPWLYLVGAFLALSILAGHFSPFLHSVVALAFLAAFVAVPRLGALDAATRLVFASAVGVSVAAVQVLPTLEYFADAYRWIGTDEPVRGLATVPYDVFGRDEILHPAQLGGFFTPRHDIRDGAALFIGRTALIIALIGAAAAIATPLRPALRRLAWSATALAAYALVVALGDHTPMGWISYHTPLVNKVREPVRMLFLYHFAASLLVAIGIAAIVGWTERAMRRVARPIAAVMPAAVAVALVGVVAFETASFRNLSSVWADGALNFPDTFYRRTPLIDFLETEHERHRRLYRISAGRDVLPPNIGNVYAMSTTLGHRATMHRPYHKYLGRDWNAASRSQQLLGVRWLVAPSGQATVDPSRFDQVFDDGTHRVFERRDPLPIFQLLSWGEPPIAADVERVRWHHNSVTVHLTPGGRPATLVLAQPHVPGWIATVDGKRRPVVPIDAFMGVYLKGHERRVRFGYQPLSVFAGGALTAITLLAAACAVWIRSRRRRIVHAPPRAASVELRMTA